MQKISQIYKTARELSWATFGREITFFLPGMFSYYGLQGLYPAVSVTGNLCSLQCDHCQGKILATMPAVDTPDRLLEKALNLEKHGHKGMLISGGCDTSGRLPWKNYVDVIAEIKNRTNLLISVHCGFIDKQSAQQLKDAGVDQALLDVIGDDETLQKIYHVNFGVERIHGALEALNMATLPVIPHIVCGLDYGEIRGERQAVDMLADYDIDQLVIVSLMHFPGTPMHSSKLPDIFAVAEVIAEARLKLPQTLLSLGCARQRGSHKLEMLAIDAGVNRMAIPSKEAIAHAKKYNLSIRYQRTCCSVVKDFTQPQW